MAHNCIQISRRIKQSIRLGKYERMLAEEPKPLKDNPFIDDKTIDDNPIPKHEPMKKRDGKMYELRNVPGCNQLKKWYLIDKNSEETREITAIPTNHKTNPFKTPPNLRFIRG
jgi:hypothetical protein